MGIATPPLPGTALPTPPRRGRLRYRVLRSAALLLLVYLAVAYLVMPGLWRRYDHRHPSLADIPGITHTAAGIPGDPLNVALIGTKAQVMKVMLAAEWYPADALSLRSRQT